MRYTDFTPAIDPIDEVGFYSGLEPRKVQLLVIDAHAPSLLATHIRVKSYRLVKLILERD